MAELKSEEERDYEAEIEKIIDSNISDDEKRKQLDDYHESDIANVVEKLTKDERIKLYKILGNEKTAEVFSYLEDVDDYVDELDYDKAADIIQEMDADDAVDVLDELGEELAALGVDGSLLVLGGRPLGMTGHNAPSR